MDPFTGWGNKPYQKTVNESKCDVCKEPATRNIQQVDGTFVGLCDNDYLRFLKHQREALDKGSKTTNKPKL